MLILETPPAQRHSVLEDVFGLLVGTLLVALAVQFLQAGGLLTGQIAGLALLVAYAAEWSFGVVFFVLNLPFYVLAVAQMGKAFTLRTFAAVALLSGFSEVLSRLLVIETLHPGVSAALAGVAAGMGLLALFRHGATLGGVGIVALWLQETRGIKAGHVQLGFDTFVCALALWLFPFDVVAWSFLGAALLNLMITLNHRQDRYIARS